MGNNPGSIEGLIARNKEWKSELTEAYGEQSCACDDVESALSHLKGLGGKLHSGSGPQ